MIGNGLMTVLKGKMADPDRDLHKNKGMHLSACRRYYLEGPSFILHCQLCNRPTESLDEMEISFYSVLRNSFENLLLTKFWLGLRNESANLVNKSAAVYYL
jgi:hypothetical protein